MDWIYRLFRPCRHVWTFQGDMVEKYPPVDVQMCGKCWRIRYLKW